MYILYYILTNKTETDTVFSEHCEYNGHNFLFKL